MSLTDLNPAEARKLFAYRDGVKMRLAIFTRDFASTGTQWQGARRAMMKVYGIAPGSVACKRAWDSAHSPPAAEAPPRLWFWPRPSLRPTARAERAIDSRGRGACRPSDGARGAIHLAERTRRDALTGQRGGV